MVDWLRTGNRCDECGDAWLAPFGETVEARCPRCGSHATRVSERSRLVPVFEALVHFAALCGFAVAIAFLFVPLLFAISLGASHASGTVVGDALGERLEGWARRRET